VNAGSVLTSISVPTHNSGITNSSNTSLIANS
jgi:hypothetical protein